LYCKRWWGPTQAIAEKDLFRARMGNRRWQFYFDTGDLRPTLVRWTLFHDNKTTTSRERIRKNFDANRNDAANCQQPPSDTSAFQPIATELPTTSNGEPPPKRSNQTTDATHHRPASNTPELAYQLPATPRRPRQTVKFSKLHSGCRATHHPSAARCHHHTPTGRQGVSTAGRHDIADMTTFAY